MRRARGFTLIELMITVAVIGILTAIAYPSYQDYVRRAVRSQGQQFLMDMAQRQEQYLLNQRQYAAQLDAGGLNLSMPAQLTGKYQAPAFIVNNAATPPTFIITLSPVAGGTQARDGALIIDNLQRRWREIDGNNTLGANDCRWEDTRCTPS